MTALYLCWNQRNRRFVGDEILIVFEEKDGWLDFSKNNVSLTFPAKRGCFPLLILIRTEL